MNILKKLVPTVPSLFKKKEEVWEQFNPMNSTVSKDVPTVPTIPTPIYCTTSKYFCLILFGVWEQNKTALKPFIINGFGVPTLNTRYCGNRNKCNLFANIFSKAIDNVFCFALINCNHT